MTRATTTDGRTDPRPAVAGRAAAADVDRREHCDVDVPLIGRLQLPPAQNLAFYAGLAAMVALELIEWPVALVLAAGHALADQNHSRALHEFGEALEDI